MTQATQPASEPKAEPLRFGHINGRLMHVMRKLGAIAKSRNNDVQKFQYRGVDDVFNELHQHCAEAGIMPRIELDSVEQRERTTAKGGTSLHYVLRCRINWVAEDGQETNPVLWVGEASDTGDKGIGKAQQYALKMYLLEVFLIPTNENSDPDAQSVEWAAVRKGEPQRPRNDRSQAEGRPQRPPQQGGGKPAAPPEQKPPGAQAAPPQQKPPTPAEVFAKNKQMLDACQTLADVEALQFKGSKYMGAEEQNELRKLRDQRKQELRKQVGAETAEQKTQVDPMQLRLTDAFTRLVKLNKAKANEIVQALHLPLDKRVELLEEALTVAEQAGKTATAFQPGYEDMK